MIALLAGLCLNAVSVWSGVRDLAGQYVGIWTNITFHSTGKAAIEIQVADAQATLTFDMDGYVFGMMDPPVISMPGTVNGDTILINNAGVGMFGAIEGSIDAAQGTFAVNLTDIPGGSIQSVTAVGAIGAGVIDLEYTVYFPRPSDPYNPAHGRMLTTLVPHFSITSVKRQGDNLLIEWTGGEAPFQVQACADIHASGWTAVGSPVASRTATVPIGTARQTFLRIAGH